MAVPRQLPVRFEDVFPAGAFATSVEMVRDFDASKGGADVQARDPAGQLVWEVHVYDADPAARKKERAVAVKVAASVQPVLPEAMAGAPFRPVEFDGLTVTPYVNQQGRLAYSLRATALRGPAVTGKSRSASAA
jgi:hypothetical protein